MIRNDLLYREYAAIDAVNWSRLKAIDVSPLQYEHERLNPRAETGYLRVGIATHALILEPATFKERFVTYEGRRQGKAWDVAKAFAQTHGLQTLSTDEARAAFGCAAAVLANTHAAALLQRGLKEASFTWTDAETGLLCKGRVDHAGRNLVDLKTAARIGQGIFAAAATRLGYHSQLAYYADGLAANGLDVGGDPYLVVVQSEMPHDVIVYRMDERVIAAGRAGYRALLLTLKKCRETNTWPGMAPDGPIDFVLPAWAGLDDDSDDLTFDGVSMNDATAEGD